MDSANQQLKTAQLLEWYHEMLTSFSNVYAMYSGFIRVVSEEGVSLDLIKLGMDENPFLYNASEKINDSGVEEHHSLGGSIISRLDNGAFVGLIYKLLVFS